MFKTVGRIRNQSESRGQVEQQIESSSESESEPEVDPDPVQLDPFHHDNEEQLRPVTNRLAQKICFVCKSRLGATQSLRIGKY